MGLFDKIKNALHKETAAAQPFPGVPNANDPDTSLSTSIPNCVFPAFVLRAVKYELLNEAMKGYVDEKIKNLSEQAPHFVLEELKHGE